MLGLSDRDSKIILLLLIVAVVVVPYILYTKGLREETEVIKGENVTLQKRLEELQEMNKNRDFYVKETERMKKERDELIASFPADVDAENYTMFLQYLEINSALKAEENFLAQEEDEDDETPRFGYDGVDGNTTVMISTVSYGDNDLIAISDEESTEQLFGIINDSTLTLTCFYEGMRYFLDYIADYEMPMIYKELEMEYDAETGQLEAEALIEQWAISGPGRVLEPAPVWPDLDEAELRGILENHLFGPLSPEALYLHQMFEVYLEELGEEEEEDEAPGMDME